MQATSQKISGGFSRKWRGQRGTTLVEMMVSVLVFSGVIITVTFAMFQAYRLTVQIRCRDQARFILTSVSDRFLRAGHRLEDGSIRTIFTVSSIETGTGLCWNPDLKLFMIPYLPGIGSQPSPLIEGTAPSGPDPGGLILTLGDPTSTSAVQARLWRKVQRIDPTTGQPTAAAPTAAGALLRGDFHIKFTFMNREYNQTTTVVRAIEP